MESIYKSYELEKEANKAEANNHVQPPPMKKMHIEVVKEITPIITNSENNYKKKVSPMKSNQKSSSPIKQNSSVKPIPSSHPEPNVNKKVNLNVVESEDDEYPDINIE